MTLPIHINGRVLKAVVLSLLLHGAALAGWRPATLAPQLAAFEPIEVALLGAPVPREHVAPPSRPVVPARAQQAELPPVADDANSETAPPPEPAGETAARDVPLVQARADVAGLNNPKPPYPLAARRRGIEGRVVLTALVRADGACAEVRIKRSSGFGLLDDAALGTVRRWRFLPAQRGDTAIDSWVDVPVSFRLEG